MTMGMTEDEYMAKFEMLVGRTAFNEVALEDTFIQGLPQPILPRFTPRPHDHQDWTTGRQLYTIWITSIRDLLN